MTKADGLTKKIAFKVQNDLLHEQFARDEITIKEFNNGMREIDRDIRDKLQAITDISQRAYDLYYFLDKINYDEMSGWFTDPQLR
jgi:hypothetical protein